MDIGRLPAYRSSYLLRFHPYPRGKPSARERIMAPTWKDEFDQIDGPLQAYTLQLESDSAFTLNQTIQGTGIQDEIRLRHRCLSILSLVIELALSFARKLSLQHD